MLDRRQFVQSGLSLLAGTSLAPAAQASSLAESTPPPFELPSEALPTTVDQALATEPKIKVIGVGGGGCRAARHMVDSGVAGVEFIFFDTDTSALDVCAPHKTIQLQRSTQNAGTEHGRSQSFVEMAANEVRLALDGTHLLFITVGMGGDTGTEAAPVIARVAKKMGIETVALVTMPFGWEGPRRMHNAEKGLAELKSHLDSVIVSQNDRFLEVFGATYAFDDAFEQANEVMKKAVNGIAEIIMAERSSADAVSEMDCSPDQALMMVERKLASRFLKMGVI
jgi:cell division GTPase FtsZ